MNSTSPPPPEINRSHALEMALHNLLVVGVTISSILLILGLITSFVSGKGLPDTMPTLQQIIPLVLAFKPAGLLALGLLVLIATPILRVAGSVIGFLYERDWRYALITFIVLLIVLSSIFLGKE